MMSVLRRRHMEKNAFVRTARFPLHYEVRLAKGDRILRGGAVWKSRFISVILDQITFSIRLTKHSPRFRSR
jgi:hypothetical protein